MARMVPTRRETQAPAAVPLVAEYYPAWAVIFAKTRVWHLTLLLAPWSGEMLL